MVSSIDASDFVALLEVREVLEGLAASLAAQRATTAELSRLEEHADQFRSLGTDDEVAESGFVVLDMSFHQLIREMARNDELGVLLGRTEARAHLSMHSLWSGVRHVEATQTEHTNICSAILSRDPSRADAAARDHIGGLRNRALAAIAEHDRQGDGELR